MPSETRLRARSIYGDIGRVRMDQKKKLWGERWKGEIPAVDGRRYYVFEDPVTARKSVSQPVHQSVMAINQVIVEHGLLVRIPRESLLDARHGTRDIRFREQCNFDVGRHLFGRWISSSLPQQPYSVPLLGGWEEENGDIRTTSLLVLYILC